MSIIALPTLPFLLGKSVDLNCTRLEVNYVNCQQQRFHFYHLWSEPAISFRLTGAVIEKYDIQTGDSRDTGYKIYLTTSHGKKEFYDYRRDDDFALNVHQTLNQFLKGSGEKSLHILASKSFWGEMELIPVGFGYMIIGFFLFLVLLFSCLFLGIYLLEYWKIRRF
ncbi:hypothetical protein [Brasilonema sp. UFV-L1]|uniref:hypothetical protein n=1 Tax=Brasilonema sp. UFV-L1 TaxID=2234130 RepID=UPI00145D5F6B|nr:hypothetical protein [Brasilonema sp. UFV-L1]